MTFLSLFEFEIINPDFIFESIFVSIIQRNVKKHPIILFFSNSTNFRS